MPGELGAFAHLSWVRCDGPICSALGAGTLSYWGPGGGRHFDGSYKPKPKQTQCGKNTRKCHCSPGFLEFMPLTDQLQGPLHGAPSPRHSPPCAHAPCPSCSQGSGLRRCPRRCCTQRCGSPSVGLHPGLLPELGPGRKQNSPSSPGGFIHSQKGPGFGSTAGCPGAVPGARLESLQ